MKISDLKKARKRLKEINKNFSEYDNYSNYVALKNACQEIDDELYETELVEQLREEHFVPDGDDDDEMRYEIEFNSSSLERLRHFIGDTHSADIYKINAYGNLENITVDDIRCACSNLIDYLSYQIEKNNQM